MFRHCTFCKAYHIDLVLLYGYPLANYGTFDTELVSKIIYDLKRGKAPDIYGLTAEHLLQAHPILSVILSILFRLQGGPKK